MPLSIDESENLSLSLVPSTTRSLKSSSSVHEHCRTPTVGEREEKPESKWMWCKYCQFSAQCTTNMRNHLWSAHDIEVAVHTTATDNVESLYAKLLQLNENESLYHEVLRRTVKQKDINDSLLDLVMAGQLPFSCVEWPEFRALVQALNPQGCVFIPTSQDILEEHFSSWYIQAKDIVRKRLQSSQTSIHLTVDIWRSSSSDLLLGVCASFVDAQDSFRNILIALRPVRDRSGQSQWGALLPVLQDYGIDEKIGTVVSDNSTTNDTLGRNMSSYLTSKKINWIYTHQHLRCMGHVLHLTVQAFLFLGESQEQDMELYDQEQGLKEESGAEYQKGRANTIRARMGVVGKVHNIVVHIHTSPHRTNEFENAAGKLIPLDNCMRWNDWFRMLQVALEQPVLSAIRNYAEEHIALGTLDKKDGLCDDDILVCRTIANFLEVFDGASLYLQGQQSTIERVLEVVEIIQEHLELSLRNNKSLKSRVESAKAKFDSYIEQLDLTPYYAAARILNPESRTIWIKDSTYKLRVDSLWEMFRRESHPSFPSYETVSVPAQTLQQPINRFEQLRRDLRERHRQPQSQDEFKNYCNETVSYGLKIPAIEWWLQDTQKKRWPQLSSWAIEVLSIPSMSDKSKRVFSGGSRTVSWDKTYLTATTLEQFECGKDWKREDFLIDNF